jgi:ABC-type multidrug transport system ATPase subunit
MASTAASLRGVSVVVPRSAIFGCGPNGAGKTTLLSILATLLLPDGGNARVLGLDMIRDAGRVRERINLSSGSASFLWSLTPREILDIAARSYGLGKKARLARLAELLDQFELVPHAGVPYNELSTESSSAWPSPRPSSTSRSSSSWTSRPSASIPTSRSGSGSRSPASDGPGG